MHVRLDRILVPTDLSPLGDQAVAYAIALAPPSRVIETAAARRVTTLFHVVRDRTPADAIFEMAEQLDMGAVCMTTHGCSGLTHLMGGSVAQEVARKIRKPLILVRPGQA